MTRKFWSSALLFFLIQSASRAEVFCGKVRPLKPVQCVCGKITDSTGGFTSGVTVKVIKDGIDLATVETDGTGTFNFGELKSGRYELSADIDGLVPFRFRIVVENPAKQCKRGLLIRLEAHYPDNCGSYVVGMRKLDLPKNSN